MQRPGLVQQFPMPQVPHSVMQFRGMNQGGMNQAVIAPRGGCMPGTFSPLVQPQFGLGGDEHKRKRQRKQQDPNAPPPEPLNDDQVRAATAAIEAHGGCLTLGKLTTLFEGLKKSQVEPHFYITPIEGRNGECSVSLTPDAGVASLGGLSGAPVTALGVRPASSYLFQRAGAPAGGGEQQTTEKTKKRRAKPDPNAPPPPQLEPALVQAIASHLEAEGGTMRLGKITTLFEGVKKVQLDPHFNIFPIEGTNGEYAVSMDPAVGPGSLPAGIAYSGPNDAAEAPKQKRQRKPRDPDAPPPEPLDDQAVAEIRNFVLEQGGTIGLGKLTTVFEGVKKVQLEPHFVVVSPENSGHYTLYLDQETADQVQGLSGQFLGLR